MLDLCITRVLTTIFLFKKAVLLARARNLADSLRHQACGAVRRKKQNGVALNGASPPARSKRKMAILQLCKFFPPDWGGVETVSYNLMQGFGSLGVANGAIAFGPSDRTDYIKNSGVTSPVHRIRGRILFKR